MIGNLCGRTEAEIKALREGYNIRAAYKMVDRPARQSLRQQHHTIILFTADRIQKMKQFPHRIRKKFLFSVQVRSVSARVLSLTSALYTVPGLLKEGYETIIINNNPETVSTDFDIADKLYFEPLTPEDVENIVKIEKPDGAVVQFGGQTAIKLTEALMKMGVKILGTSAEDVDAAEDRELFDGILEQCQIPRPKGDTVFTAEEAKRSC